MTLQLADGPLLWFLNRGTGMVLLVVLTGSVVLGLLGAGRDAGGRIPAFVPQELHRNLSVLALALTAAHAVTAVVDTFVDIRWWQSAVPFGSQYEPFWLGLGALALDLMLVVALTSAARRRLGHRSWQRVHLLGYLVWPVAFAHGAGIGTDAAEPWAQQLAIACVAAVAAALAVRIRRLRRSRQLRDDAGFSTAGRRR